MCSTCESYVQLFEYFIVYCNFLFAIYPCTFCKIAPINFVMVTFAKKICKCTVLNGDVPKCRIIMSRGYYFGSLNKIAILFSVFVALRPKSTAMVIAGRSVHLTTRFPGQA